MNVAHNRVLTKRSEFRKALEKLEGGDASASTLGPISIARDSMRDRIRKYEEEAKREMNPAKKKDALECVKKFRNELEELGDRYEAAKKQQEHKQHEENRNSLLRRPTKKDTAPEYPYQPMSRTEFDTRERQFAHTTESHLDDFILQAQTALESLTDQNHILKNAQTKILDVANNLGLSQNVIRYIERRTAQDKVIFYVGLAITVFLIWAVIHYLR